VNIGDENLLRVIIVGCFFPSLQFPSCTYQESLFTRTTVTGSG